MGNGSFHEARTAENLLGDCVWFVFRSMYIRGCYTRYCDGAGTEKRVIALLFSVLRFVFPARIKFVQFSIYAVLLLLYAIVKLISARKEKPYLNYFLLGIFFLVAGSVLQNIKSLKFHIILDFDYNSIYHIFTLFLILCVHKGLKSSQQA